MHIAIVVQGAFLIGDSIANDAVWQYNLLKQVVGTGNVCLFAERFSTTLFPDVKYTPYNNLDAWMSNHPSGIIIYHFCDGWPDFEDKLHEFNGRKIVRWHNNTPPWFYVTQSSALRGTIRGLKRIRELAKEQKLEVWTNSEFSVRQLKILIDDRQRAVCVYPASNYLDSEARPEPRRRLSASCERGATLRLLFVGRVVAHKGHKHVIAVADLIARVRGCKVVVDFVGRRDEEATLYNEELARLAQSARCEVVFHGGLSPAELDERYKLADVFLCLSEHEGFGLPAFEAMRHGLVVVAWANTAYEDLLAESPFALREFELASFAAAVELATTASQQKTIHDVQANILKLYTRNIVLTQIMTGLGLDPPPLADHERSQGLTGQTRALRAAIFKTADAYRLAEKDGLGATTTHDFVGNYISAYDVEYFSHLLENESPTHKLLDVLKIEESETTAALLSPVIFSSKIGTLEDGVYKFLNLHLKDGHLIYGPYLTMPAGRFGFRFQMRLSQIHSAPSLMVEVVVNQRVLASRPVVLEGGLCEGYVEHEFLTPESEVELRICVVQPVKLSGAFEGVVIERLPAISELVPASAPPTKDEARGQAAPGGARLHLPARSFKTHRGRLVEDMYEIEIEPWSEDHIFFGPYIEVPKGRYQIAIDLKVTPSPRQMYFEIADGGEVVERREVEAGSNGRITLEATVDCDLVKGEFRLKVEADAWSRALFRGIDITRLATLSSLLVEGKELTPRGIKSVVGVPRSVFYEPLSFESGHAEQGEDRLVFSAQTIPAGTHLIYGPYIAVPPGRFRFRFHFDFIRFDTDDVVTIDIANEGQTITYRNLRASQLNENTTIECEFLTAVGLCEFRLSTRSQADVLGVFLGVTAERLPALSALASKPLLEVGS